MHSRRWRLLTLSLLPLPVLSQYSNGQFFTPGLAIVSSPQPSSQEHVGSTLSIAIAVGGNQGQIQNFSPGSSSSSGTGYDNLELFLISSQHNINISVATDILDQDQNGGNVKHVDYQIPTCVPSGNYNLSLYETSRFNNNAIFVITQVPINIQNSQSPGGSCPNNLAVQVQPQADSPLTGSPWLTQVNKQATVGAATLATTNNVVLVATQPQASQGQGQNQAAGSGSSSGSGTVTSIIQVPPSTSTSTAFVVATVAAGGNGSGSKLNPAVVVQTVTITSSVVLATGGGANMNNGGAGVLFPVSSRASRALPRDTWITGLVMLFIILVDSGL